MNAPIESPKLPQDESTSVGKVGRRRFLGAGSAVTPVILTLFSQPALGTGITCFTPSRSLSRNTSLSQADKNGICDGKSPGNYKEHDTNWPGYPRPDTPFHDVFSGTRHLIPKDGGGLRSRTMREVMNLGGGGDPSQIAFHIIGAYLNCIRLLVPAKILTPEDVKTIWRLWDAQGYYEVTAGVKWGAPQIVDYLKSSKIAP